MANGYTSIKMALTCQLTTLLHTEEQTGHLGCDLKCKIKKIEKKWEMVLSNRLGSNFCYRNHYVAAEISIVYDLLV